MSTSQSKPKMTPPKHLSKETLIIWDGWSKMGLREVVRESAAKGYHVELAYSFLQQKKQVSLENVKSWFKEEVMEWTTELLKNKQIFRASHILKNIKLDPFTEITNIMLKQNDVDIVNFLASHLEKNGQLSEDIQLQLKLYNIILKDVEVLESFRKLSGVSKLEGVTLSALLSSPEEWKSEVVAKLFLKYTDFTLSPLLSSKHLWMQTLRANDVLFLQNWLELQYQPPLLSQEDHLSILLTNLKITEQMLDDLAEQDDIIEETKEFVYDTLSKFGKFNSVEKQDINKIITRMSRNNLTENLEEILAQPSANLTHDKFKLLLREHCLKYDMFIILDACLHDEDFLQEDNNEALALMKSCKDVALNPNNKQVLITNIQGINTFLQALTENDEQFQVLLKIILARLQNEDLQTFLMNNSHILDVLPTLKILLNKILTNAPCSGINRYDLLRNHMKLDVDRLFAYRFNGNNEKQPNFKCAELVQKFGKHKQLDYASYLFHCRPGKALKLVGKENNESVERKVRRLAIKEFLREDIASACLYFLDCLKMKTDELKIELEVAKLLKNQGKLDIEEIVDLFLSGKTYEIVKLYEQLIFPSTNEEFIENYIQLELIIKLSTFYGCKLPEIYLEQLANESKWIEFLFIVHKFEYPQEQVNMLVASFTNDALYDHLSHALAHDLVFEPKNVLHRDRDARKFFLARIGLLKHMENDVMSSVTSQSSWGSNTSSSGLSDYITEVESLSMSDNRTDLLQILIRCHNSNDPPKALLYACQHYNYPLLAVLATTYEPDSVITCWLTWLSISVGIPVESCERLATVGSSVLEFLKKIAQKSYYKTLQQSMSIFLSDNPLKTFIDFLFDCHNLNFDIHHHNETLRLFNKKLKLKRSNSFVAEMDHEMLYLNNKLWIENTAISLLASLLNSQEKPYQQVRLLKTIMDLNLKQYFMVFLPNLANLYKYYTYFYDGNITIPLDFYNLFDENQYHSEIKTCILQMLAQEMYDEALKVAQVENILIDEILIKKYASATKEEQETEPFWVCCEQEFKKYAVSAENVVEFYQNVDIQDEILRYKILMFAYAWCRKFKLRKQQDVELEMWKTYLKLPQNMPIEIDKETRNNYLEMKTDIDLIVVHYQDELSPTDTEKLDSVICKLLKANAIYQALRLKKIFVNYSNTNLEIIRLCYSLAEGIILPIQLTAKERLLIRRVKSNRTYSHRRKPLFSFRLSGSSRSPASSLGATLIDVEPKVQDTLSLIESLVEGLTCGTELGERILMTYRISINTDISYNNILEIQEPTALLLNAVQSRCLNKIEVAHDFFCVYNWNKEQIADFLCEQLINAVNASTKAKQGFNMMWDVNLDQEIHLILQLMQDSCSKLGIKLYSYSSALHKAITVTEEMTNIFELTVVIELLILSHECYTYDCNMEGISIILKKCQILINLLLALKNWSLIVRLLTGVGRYNELNYVFHILRDNDQFEFLLRKGSAKDNGLRVALLDYLKKFCPDNRQLYEMVALYFSLYSEVALLWEAESRQSIKNLIAISKLEMINRKINPDECIFVEFSNTEGTKICLSKVMENFSHAAEYHLQGEKLAKAMNAAQQAELIALQISLIKTVPMNGTTKCILNLTSLQISALFSTLTFHQALIVTEAFNYQADWAQILFEQFIIKNDTKYFDNYCMTFNITENLVHNMSRHYLAKNVQTEHGANNMKLILKMLSSIHTKYRIASELGFSDLVERLLNSDKLNYLKDTVWKRGYRE